MNLILTIGGLLLVAILALAMLLFAISLKVNQLGEPDLD
jgi:hypothetical protein